MYDSTNVIWHHARVEQSKFSKDGIIPTAKNEYAKYVAYLSGKIKSCRLKSFIITPPFSLSKTSSFTLLTFCNLLQFLIQSVYVGFAFFNCLSQMSLNSICNILFFFVSISSMSLSFFDHIYTFLYHLLPFENVNIFVNIFVLFSTRRHLLIVTYFIIFYLLVYFILSFLNFLLSFLLLFHGFIFMYFLLLASKYIAHCFR